MSLWADLEDRSSGDVIRKEDQVNENLWGSSEPVAQPLVFAGTIDKNNIPSLPASGQLFFTNDTVIINGVTYPSGCMLLFDRKSWHNVGDFMHQSIDAGIGYYNPVYTANSIF